MVKVYNILLLEDDLHSANVVIRILEKYNFEITHCDNVRNGLAKVKEIRFDLIISDIMMPAQDGFSFLSMAEKDIKDIPIIMLTAVKEKETVMKAVHLKVGAYIIKPFQKNDLLLKIAEALKVKFDSFIYRKDFPFLIIPNISDPNTLEISISGIPQSKQIETIEDKVKQIRNENPKISRITLTINEEFGYGPNHILNAELMVTILCKVFRLKAKSVLLKGTYFKNLSFPHLEANSILLECVS